MTGTLPPEMIEPELPGPLAYVWHWFVLLSAGRGSSGFGPAPLGYRDIAAWAELMHLQLTPLEVDLLRALDGVFFVECVAEPTKKKG